MNNAMHDNIGKTHNPITEARKLNALDILYEDCHTLILPYDKYSDVDTIILTDRNGRWGKVYFDTEADREAF